MTEEEDWKGRLGLAAKDLNYHTEDYVTLTFSMPMISL